MASLEKVALDFFKVKLFVFKRIIVLEIPFSPLTWQANHEQQFLDLA
jgi:hypothetical protein